jgi:thymidylate synthase
MNNLDKQYQTLLQTILDCGIEKGDRTGTGTKSIFGYTIRHNMKEGFPLITTKKIPFRLIVTELLWFLRGDTNIKFLVDNGCHIWDGDAYKNYCEQQSRQLIKGCTYQEFIDKIKTDDEFAQKWGNLGPVYGAQWRAWGGYDKIPSGYNHGSITHFKEVPKHDQIASLINDLKTNPDSRRLMVNAWNVGELDQMVLPPCHYGFQVYTRELTYSERNLLYVEKFGETVEDTDAKWELNTTDTFENDLNKSGIPKRAISLMWNQRSVDTFLGLPFNIASYGLLLEIIAKEVNMVPDELIGSLGDTHLYLNHIEQAKEQIGRELSLEERKEIYEKEYTDGMKVQNDEWLESKLKTRDIPTRTREPYPLPTLKHMKTDEFYKALSEDTFLFAHLDPTDFQVENYQAHPHIKAPLSN